MTTIFTAVTAVIFLGICYYAGESDVDEQSTALEQETTTATTAKLSTTTATTTADETAN